MTPDELKARGWISFTSRYWGFGHNHSLQLHDRRVMLDLAKWPRVGITGVTFEDDNALGIPPQGVYKSFDNAEAALIFLRMHGNDV